MLALEQALEIIQTQEVWNAEDDLCDCTYQRIGYWFNPYIGETEEKRICCIDKKLREWFPECFRTTVQEPAQWNGEADMPKAIWHRQLAAELGMPLSQVRDMGLEPPKGQPRKDKPRIYLPLGGGEYAEFVLR